MLLLIALLSPIVAQYRGGSGSSGATPCPCGFCCCGWPLLLLIPLSLVWIPALIGMWKSFEKAGEQGWSALIPVYNCMIAAKISGRPESHGLLILIPFGVGIVFWVIICIDIAKSFGREGGFGVGLALLGPVFWAILGFGDARYEGPAYEGGEIGYSRARPKRRRRREEEYEDDDDRPLRRRDEDDDDRPSRRDDDVDDRPRGRRDSDSGTRRSRRDEDDD